MERTIHNHRTAPEAGTRTPGSEPPFVAAKPRIAMVHNPRSHRNKGRQAENVEGVDITVVQPRTKDELSEALAQLRDDGVEFLIINGGDGTIRDVLTMGQLVFGENWPTLAVLPRGKTNALNVDLGAPSDWSLSAAVEALRSGKRVQRRALTVAGEGSDELPMLGFIFGAGAFTLGIEAGQDAHRIGFFDSLAVGATAAWGVLQVLFGSNANRWRRGTAMELAYEPSGEAMAHSTHGDPGRRHIMLATTLQRMPMGIQLFAKDQAPIRLAILDRPRRRIFASLPAILSGWHPAWLSSAGLHQISAEAFSIELEAPFILDGEHFPAGRYHIGQGPELTFVTA
ncbi:diacylglycerol/lipid kinase family protein [Qipengyuania nanhaisediminis]|uniref:Diacylglycerol kinase family enzyme n=1 Tax=Qipengyuania nanhaisediminis TaxID=604088 RepID=A0A1I5KRE2_9SPHN|nr:diacylglycerol kinase family protein [Qipengyuania nanhaisediminis]SFO87473.1 Diacylglycerol kinase family enzyme [Qipengyuania nanhaisediminis]